VSGLRTSLVKISVDGLEWGGWLGCDLDEVILGARSRLYSCFLLMHRLYSKGRVLGHKRAKRNTRPNTSLIQIEGVTTKEDAQFYLGKVRIHFSLSAFRI
jgi:hypothetical protein